MHHFQLPTLQEVGDLMEQIGRSQFPVVLDGIVGRVAPFDLSAVFGFPFNTQPLLLYDGYRQHASPGALKAYLGGAYLLDPFYTASVEAKEPGLWRMRDLAPDGFFDSEFYQSVEVHPCVSLLPGSLVEEIGYLIPLESGLTVVYSLMRSQGRPFSAEEMARLNAIEPIVRQSIRMHWRHIAPAQRHISLDDLMETAFATFCQSKLTYHQKRIVQLILRGHSNASIGQLMSVTEGTVKIHRQNIYKRLNISSQRELFAMFVDGILSHTERL